MQANQLHLGIWEEFKERFLECYFPKFERQNLRSKFERLVQGSNSVEKYRQEFNDLSRYAPSLVATEEEKCIRFEAGLKIQIRMGLASVRFAKLRDLVDAAKRLKV